MGVGAVDGDEKMQGLRKLMAKEFSFVLRDGVRYVRESNVLMWLDEREKEKSASHSILGYEDILNCIASKVRKTRKGNFVIPLVDICGQEYGKVILEDNFGFDLNTVENVSLQTKKKVKQ